MAANRTVPAHPPPVAAHRPWCTSYASMDRRRAVCNCGASILHVAENALLTVYDRTLNSGVCADLNELVASALKEIKEWKENYHAR